MADIDRYLEAATRDNTRRSYQSAVRHFELEWGGFLPASADSIARYLAEHAQMLSINTLRQRLAAIAQWHVSQGFPDPTRAPHVRKVRLERCLVVPYFMMRWQHITTMLCKVKWA